MSKQYFDEYKKKKDEEKKTGAKPKPQSSSVTNTTKNSTFMGGGASVKKVEERAKGPSTTKANEVAARQEQRRTQNTTAAQRQKMGMQTSADIQNARESRRELRTRTSNAIRQASSEENKGFMQRQKSGTQTASDLRRTEQMAQRRTEVARNTGAAARKGAEDAWTGYRKTMADITDLTSSTERMSYGQAAKLGIDKDKDTVQWAKLEGRRKKTQKLAREQMSELQKKQDERQAEWDERTKNATGLEKALYGAAESGTGMLVDIGIGAASGTGQFGALASMGMRSYGTARGQAEKEGATANEDRLYALMQAGKEVGTELMFPGAGVAKKAYGKVGLSLADRAANVLTKGLTGKKADIVGAGVRLLGGTAEENVEEFAGWGLDPILKEIAYGRNVRQRTAESLRANLPEVTNQAEAEKVAAYFNTSEFTDDLTEEYRQSGMSEEDAKALAAEMRDYYVAYYSGDQERLEELEDDLSRKLSGQPGLSTKAWSMDELGETFAATTLLTMATGLPGAVTTSVKGNQAFGDPNSPLRQMYGDNAVKLIANAVKNVSDKELSVKAESMEKRLESGKDLTGTQKWDLMQGYQQKLRETAEKAQASNSTVEKARQAQNLVRTMGMDDQGNRVYAKETQREFNQKYAETELTVEGIKNYLESENSISDDDARRSDAVKKAVADFHVGGMTVGDAHEFAYGNTLAREALKMEEGIDLDQYIVRDKNGEVDYAATNEATENALFALNADNAIRAAQNETRVYIDDTRGEIDSDILGRMGVNGQATWKNINKTVDPRNINEYLTTARAASYFYAAGRNTDMDMEDAINQYSGGAFKNVSKTALRRAFAAGSRDRIIANTPGYGQPVSAGSNIAMKNTAPKITGQLIMDNDIQTSVPDTVQQAYIALAMSTNTNIHLVGDLSAKGKDGKPIIDKSTGLPVQLNGMSKGSDIYINVNASAEQHLGYVFMHEMTHQLKQYAPNEYMALENLVRDRWFNKNNAQMQHAIQSRIDLYRTKGGQSLTEEEAMEEIIADAMAEAMDDPNFAAQVCEEDINLGQAILNSIKAALRSIRQIFASGEFQNEDFHNGLLSYLGILDDAEKLWINALHQARINKANGLIADWQDKANVASQVTNSPDSDIIMTRERIRLSLTENFPEYNQDKTNLDIAVEAVGNLYDQQLSWVDYLEGEQDEETEGQEQSAKRIPIGQLTWDDLDWSDEADGGSEARQISSVRRNKDNNSGIKTVGRRMPIPKELIQKGYIDLRGHKVSKPEDLAKLCQVLRNPMFETSRIFYLKGDTIVGHRAVSSRLPMQSKGVYAKGAKYWSEESKYHKDVMSRLGADGYYIMHNHPSGYVGASSADKGVTKNFQKYVPGLKGHIILDHDKFGWITPGGKASERAIPGITGEDPNFVPSIENEHLGIKWGGKPEDLASIGRDILQSKEGYSVVVYMNSHLEINEIQEINNKVILNDKNFSNYIKNENTRAGSGRAVIYTTEPKVRKFSEGLVKTKHFEGVVYERDPGAIIFSGGKNISGWGTTIPQKSAYIDGGTKESDSKTWYQEEKARFSISEDSHVMYTPKGVEVVQNPTDSEYNSMREEILAEYPWLRGTGEPLLRKTYDESGNEYYWNAFEAMHSQVEPYINKEYNTRTSQQWKWYEKPDKDDYPIDYSKQGYRFSITDAEGNTLSEGQAAFFADSKMVDAEGKLKPMYHGTQNEFYEFDITKAYPGTLGRGFYFSDSDSHAGVYGKTNKYYLNLVNPLMSGTNTITKDQLHRFVFELAEDEDYGLENYGYGATVNSVVDSLWGKSDFAMLRDLNLTAVGDFAEALKVFNRVNDTNYDGIITDTETLAFYPQQVKSVDNLNPTLSKDIRYSITDSDGKELTDGQVDYFKNSQARDSQGRLVPVYHTTNKGGFTIFDPEKSDDHRSLFFASNWDVSQTYGNYANSRFYYFDIDSIDDVKKYLDAYSPDRYFVTQEQFDEVGWEADFIDFENVTDGKQSDFEKYLENPDGLIAIIGVPNYSPDSRSYADEWIMANTPDELVRELHNHFGWQRDNYKMGTQHGYYPCYLNLENPLIIDAHGQYWDDIQEDGFESMFVKSNIEGDTIYVDNTSIPWTIDEIRGVYGVGFAESIEEWLEYATEEDRIAGNDVYTWYGGPFNPEEEGYPRRGNTRFWAAEADFTGYDGVIIRNLIDHGGKSEFDGLDESSDIYIAFSSEQIKDINNQNPTENPDIRYSIVDDDEAMSHAAHDYAYDNSYEALEYIESIIASSSSTEEAYEKAKQYSADNVDKFYSGLNRYADGMRFDDPVLEEGRVRMARSKQDFFNSNKAKWNDRWLTNGEVLDVKSVKKAVQDLVSGTMLNSNTTRKYNKETVDRTLVFMRLAYYYAKQGRTDIADAILWHSAHRMIDGVEFFADDGNYETYKTLRDYFKNTKIQMGEEYWNDVDYCAFRKQNFNKLNLVRGETNTDKILQDLYYEREDGSVGGLAPEWFSPEAFEKNGYKFDSAPDILLQMATVLDTVEPYAEAYSSEYCAEWATDIASDLLEIMQSGKELQSTVDKYKARYDEKAKAMKARHEEAMLKVRQQRDEGIRKQKIRFREYVERTREKQAHKQWFNRINKSYNTLKDRLLANTADSNIPQQYKKDLARLLAAFDLQTVGSKAYEARTGHVGKNTLKMAALKTALKNIENKVDEFHINDSITDIMDELLGEDSGNGHNRSIEGLTIDELNSSELERIAKMLEALIHEFNTYKSVKIAAKRQQTADIGHAQNDHSLEHAKKFGPGKDFNNGLLDWFDRVINLDEMTAAYMFRRIDPDNVGLGLMFKELKRSFDKYVRNTRQLRTWLNEILGEYQNRGKLWNKYGADEIDKWRSDNYAETIQLENGNSIRVTPAQMMSIYCLARRTQAYNHMTSGGIVVAPNSYNGQLMQDLKKKANTALPEILTESDLKNIEARLTDDQIKVAQELQKLMAEKMAAWGNEASMNVIGIELFGEPDYFPIKSDKAGLISDLDENQFVEAIRNFGFTKAVKPGAGNPIMVEDIFKVVAEHCNNMNLYNAYSESINDFMKVYNFKEEREEGKYTVKQAIAHAYSQKATTFIMQFMKDLNGNVSGNNTGLSRIYNGLLSRAKKASVFANGRVALQQPTAISRAFYVIDPKYLEGVVLNEKADEGAMQEMFEHCPIALWKSWGYYDIQMGRSIEDVMMNNGKWLDDVATDVYGALDNVTWTAIWQMVKAETKDIHPDVEVGSEDFFEICNERMSEIVDLTQVVDSPIHRSHGMRAKGFLEKTATAFMSEPTLTFNMVKDGLIRTREAWVSGNKGEAARILGRTMSVFTLQAAMVSAAAAIWDAIRGKKPDGDDDDERKLHLWWVNTIANFKDELKLWNKVYFIKDIGSLFQGYGINNLALQGWKSIADGWAQLTGSRKVYSSKEWYENLFGGVGYITGVPIKTIMTDLKAIYKWAGLDWDIVNSVSDYLDLTQEQFTEMFGKEDEESIATSFLAIFDGKNNAPEEETKTEKKPEKKSKKEKKAESDEYDAKVEEYRESLSDNYSEEQKDKLVKQYKKQLDAETEVEIPEDFSVAAHVQQGITDFEFEMEKRSIKAAENAVGKTGNARNNALWDVIAEGYTKSVESGNMATIQAMRDAFVANGGEAEWFDQKITDKMKSMYVKTISTEVTPGASARQESMKNYLTQHGVSDEELSSIVRSSATTRDLKAAMRMGVEEYILDELTPLVQAGLSYDDYEYIYEHRNYGAKQYDGKYTDPKYMISTGNFIWPTDGVITSHFGYRNAPTRGASSNHPAIDIGAPMGTPVSAADGGVVIYAGSNGGYGNSVGIKHDNGMVTYYNHLSAWNVNVGDRVGQGQQIANVGSTGISTGPHLDFKILDADGNPVDPEALLNKKS